jgi:hypothetical protein
MGRSLPYKGERSRPRVAVQNIGKRRVMKINCILNYFALSLSILLLLVGCTAQPSERPSDTVHTELLRLHDGAWIGPIPITGLFADDSDKMNDGSPMKGRHTFLLTVCDGKAIFWTRRDNGSFHAAARSENFGARSNLGNHLIYFENYDRDIQPAPGWIETQTMLVIELESGKLRAHWSRAVSNPLLSEKERDRSFSWHGVGTLEPVATECPREIMKSMVND